MLAVAIGVAFPAYRVRDQSPPVDGCPGLRDDPLAAAPVACEEQLAAEHVPGRRPVALGEARRDRQGSCWYVHRPIIPAVRRMDPAPTVDKTFLHSVGEHGGSRRQRRQSGRR